TTRPLSVLKSSAGAAAIQPAAPPGGGEHPRRGRRGRGRGDPGRRRIWIGGRGRERRREGGRQSGQSRGSGRACGRRCRTQPTPEKYMAPGAST
ncbi:unnamed protein product, partial [Musa textilis]